MKKIRIRECDWCHANIQLNGRYADPFVINGEHKIFCKIHTIGKEPEKDFMQDYLDDLKNKAPAIPLPNTIYKSDFYS
jgi:hypothetical protein